MKAGYRLLFFRSLVLGIVVFALVGCAHGKIMRIKDIEIISFDQMIQEVKDKKIILIGELHSEPKHHEYQLRIIKALHEKGIPVAIGLEMFRAESQKDLDRWTSGKVSLKQFLPIYYSNWGMPWPLYRDIFLFARDNNILLIGLNVPRETTNKVAQKGLSSLTEEEMGKLPSGISCSVDDEYMEFIKKAYKIHTTGTEFKNFCEAQMVWDSAMALYTLEYLKNYPVYTVVILAGTGHAWKRAIPEQINRRDSRYSVSVVLPEVPDKMERGRITLDDADFLILR